MWLTAPICEKVNILCVSNISARSQVPLHGSNGQFEKMYRVQKIWRWETTSASIMESLFWRLQPQNADSLVLTTLLELLYVWSGDGGCYNIACCFFSSQSCILWAAFSPRDLVSGGACFLKCASWRITPLECLWEEREGESINPRQIFHLFRFSGSTLNWDYRFCHNHLSPKFGSIRNPNFLFADQVNHLLTLLGVPGCCEWVPGVGRQTEFSGSSQGAARGTWLWTLGQLYRPMYETQS